MPRTNRSENYTWGEIFDTFKKGVLGSDEDFEDNFEEVKEFQEPPKIKIRKGPAPVTAQFQEPPKIKIRKGPASVQPAEAVIWRNLQADLSRFVQSGQASDSLLQLLREGFDKNPDLLEEVAKYIAVRRRGEERIHPGFLISYKGENSMLLSKEKALDFILSRPGAAVRETIFVSLVKDGKTVSTREANEEEKKLYYEQQSSKADTSGQCQ